MTGKIRKVFHDKQYGFITGEDGKDYFFHRKQCLRSVAWDSLYVGELITFDESETDKGLCAVNVQYS